MKKEKYVALVSMTCLKQVVVEAESAEAAEDLILEHADDVNWEDPDEIEYEVLECDPESELFDEEVPDLEEFLKERIDAP